MKQMKRAFAMLLCVAMVLSLCMAFTGVAKANYCVYYNTLNDIPENADIFRSIRTGAITHTKGQNGDWYYRFFEKGFPEVYIKESAFTIQPTNGYLSEDNLKLSQNCKNAAVKNEKTGEWWSAQRVCYYKTCSLRNDTSDTYVYTQSMYRLELNANASSNHHEVVVDAKLTSGVTFDYYTRTSQLTRRTEKLAVVPSISFSVCDGPQVERYKVLGEAPQTSVKDVVETVELISSGAACVKGLSETLAIGGIIVLVPEAAPALIAANLGSSVEALAGCGFFLYDLDKTFREADSKQLYESEDFQVQNQNVAFVSRLKLQNSENHVRAIYTLNADYSSATSFKIEFSFNSVTG